MKQNYDIALSNHYKYLTIDIHFLTIIISAKTHIVRLCKQLIEICIFFFEAYTNFAL